MVTRKRAQVNSPAGSGEGGGQPPVIEEANPVDLYLDDHGIVDVDDNDGVLRWDNFDLGPFGEIDIDDFETLIWDNFFSEASEINTQDDITEIEGDLVITNHGDLELDDGGVLYWDNFLPDSFGSLNTSLVNRLYNLRVYGDQHSNTFPASTPFANPGNAWARADNVGATSSNNNSIQEIILQSGGTQIQSLTGLTWIRQATQVLQSWSVPAGALGTGEIITSHFRAGATGTEGLITIPALTTNDYQSSNFGKNYVWTNNDTVYSNIANSGVVTNVFDFIHNSYARILHLKAGIGNLGSSSLDACMYSLWFADDNGPTVNTAISRGADFPGSWTHDGNFNATNGRYRLLLTANSGEMVRNGLQLNDFVWLVRAGGNRPVTGTADVEFVFFHNSTSTPITTSRFGVRLVIGVATGNDILQIRNGTNVIASSTVGGGFGDGMQSQDTASMGVWLKIQGHRDTATGTVIRVSYYKTPFQTLHLTAQSSVSGSGNRFGVIMTETATTTQWVDDMIWFSQ